MQQALFGVERWGDETGVGKHYDRAGISVEFNRSKLEITVGGWYDGGVGIGYETVPLRQFLDRAGISKADVDRAYALP